MLRFEGNFSPRRREGREGIFDFFLASRARECTGSGADGKQDLHNEDPQPTRIFVFVLVSRGAGAPGPLVLTKSKIICWKDRKIQGRYFWIMVGKDSNRFPLPLSGPEGKRTGFGEGIRVSAWEADTPRLATGACQTKT